MRVNKRLLIVLLCLFLGGVVLPGTWILVRASRAVDLRQFLAEAAEQAAAGNTSQAISHYEFLLRVDPSCGAAHFALAELLEAHQELGRAIRHYGAAVALDPRNRMAALRLARLAETLGLMEPLGAAADRLLATDPTNADAHRWKAIALSASRRHGPALEEAEEALRLDPGSVEAAILVSRLYCRKGRYADCHRVLLGVLGVHPGHMDALLALGQLYENRRDDSRSVEQAQDLYEEAATANPDAPAPRFHLARVLMQQDLQEQAEAQLRIAAERNPTDRAALAAYGDFLISIAHFQDARQHLERSLERMEDWREGRVLLVGALLDLGEPEQARKHFDRLPVPAKASHPGTYLEGRLLHAEGHPAGAVGKLRAAASSMPRFASAHYHLGLAHAQLGEMGSALASFRQAAARAPNSLNTQRQIAMASLALGHHEPALAAARKAVALAGAEPDVRCLLARALAAAGDIRAAVAELETAARHTEEPDSLTIELARLRVAQERYGEARRLLQSLSDGARHSAEARLLMAGIWRAVKQPAQAEKELLAAIAAAPRDVTAHTALAALYAGRGDVARAQRLLASLADANPENDAAQLALIAFHRQQGRLADALQACVRAAQRRPESIPAAQAQIDILLAMRRAEDAAAVARRLAAARPDHSLSCLALPRVLLAQGKWQEAVSQLETLRKEYPAEAEPASLLGRAFLGQGDLLRAVEQLRAAVCLRPNDLGTCYLLADTCFRNADYLEAILWAQRVTARRPGNRKARLISAWSRAKRLEYGLAIEDYLAAAPADRGPAYYLGLAALTRGAGRHADTEQALRRAYALEPTSPAVVLALIHHYSAMGTMARSADILRALEAAPSQSAGQLTLIGHYYQAARQYDAAERAYRDAIQLDQESRELHVLLGDLLLASGQTAEANRAYRAALRLGKSSARAKVARTLILQRRLTEARREIDAGLEARPSDGLLHIERARMLLVEAEHGRRGERLRACRLACNEALARGSDTPEAHLILAESYLAERPPDEGQAATAFETAVRLYGSARAGTRLARLRMRQGLLAEAEGTCRRILSSTPADTSALQTLAIVMGRRSHVRPLLALAEGIVREFPTNPARHLLLGSAHETAEQWASATAAFKACLRESPGMVEALAGLVRVRIASGDASRAIAESREFLKHNPKSATALEVLGAALVEGGQPREAAALFGKAARLDPSSAVRLTTAAAKACLDAEEPDRAMALCRDYIDRWPLDARGRSMLGSILAAYDELPRAEIEFEKALQLDPDSLSALRLLIDTLVRQDRHGDAIAACEAYRRTHPQCAQVCRLLAGLHQAQGRPQDTETWLQRALRLDGRLMAARADLGRLYMEQGKHAMAAEEFGRVVIALPRNLPALNNLAWCIAEDGGDLDSAKAFAERAVAIAPHSASALDTLGWVHCKREEYDAASRVLSRSLALRPNSPTTRYHLAVVLAARGDPAGARAQLTLALDASRSFREARAAQALLISLEETGKP